MFVLDEYHLVSFPAVYNAEIDTHQLLLVHVHSRNDFYVVLFILLQIILVKVVSLGNTSENVDEDLHGHIRQATFDVEGLAERDAHEFGLDDVDRIGCLDPELPFGVHFLVFARATDFGPLDLAVVEVAQMGCLTLVGRLRHAPHFVHVQGGLVDPLQLLPVDVHALLEQNFVLVDVFFFE
jgi:hypothetical protein